MPGEDELQRATEAEARQALAARDHLVAGEVRAIQCPVHVVIVGTPEGVAAVVVGPVPRPAVRVVVERSPESEVARPQEVQGEERLQAEEEVVGRQGLLHGPRAPGERVVARHPDAAADAAHHPEGDLLDRPEARLHPALELGDPEHGADADTGVEPRENPDAHPHLEGVRPANREIEDGDVVVQGRTRAGDRLPMALGALASEILPLLGGQLALFDQPGVEDPRLGGRLQRDDRLVGPVTRRPDLDAVGADGDVPLPGHGAHHLAIDHELRVLDVGLHANRRADRLHVGDDLAVAARPDGAGLAKLLIPRRPDDDRVGPGGGVLDHDRGRAPVLAVDHHRGTGDVGVDHDAARSGSDPLELHRDHPLDTALDGDRLLGRLESIGAHLDDVVAGRHVVLGGGRLADDLPVDADDGPFGRRGAYQHADAADGGGRGPEGRVQGDPLTSDDADGLLEGLEALLARLDLDGVLALGDALDDAGGGAARGAVDVDRGAGGVARHQDGARRGRLRLERDRQLHRLTTGELHPLSEGHVALAADLNQVSPRLDRRDVGHVADRLAVDAHRRTIGGLVGPTDRDGRQRGERRPEGLPAAAHVDGEPGLLVELLAEDQRALPPGEPDVGEGRDADPLRLVDAVEVDGRPGRIGLDLDRDGPALSRGFCGREGTHCHREAHRQCQGRRRQTDHSLFLQVRTVARAFPGSQRISRMVRRGLPSADSARILKRIRRDEFRACQRRVVSPALAQIATGCRETRGKRLTAV